MSSSSLARASVDDYLESLPKIVQSQLYEAPATCLSIYRLLPPIAKFYVMSMLFYEKPVSLRDLDKWCKPTAIKYQLESLKRLKSLHLIEEDSTGMHVRLHSTFRKNFRDCLTGTQKSNAFGKVYTSVESDNISIQFLNSFASSKWENILHFMVGTELTITPSNSVLKLLTSGGLMDGKGPKNLKITNAGFQFLLQDLNSQIWTLLLQYLNLTQELNVDPVDVLNFIFILGSLELGKSYHTSSLTETQVTILVDLKEYGLAYQPSSTTERFYPTRLATTLTSDTAGPKSASAVVDQISHSSEDDDGFTSTPNQGLIILETNFKLYAYTNSPLEIAIINLFVNLKTRFANMVCGQINRESIRNALYNGITADQIIRFLESHAHPQLKILAKEKLDKKLEFDASNNINTAGGGSSNSNFTAQHRLEILPPTVVDQIKLWQLELDRIQTFDGYLFKDFSSNREYDVLFGYASEIGVLLWSDSSRKRFFVTKDGIEQVADFANRNLQRGKK